MKPFNESVPPQKVTYSKLGEEGLHGDVIITSTELPGDFGAMPVVEDACLAYGEATGHAHKIFGEPGDFELRECPKTKVRHLKVVNPVALKHQEHNPIILPPGDYKIGIQREYDPFTGRIRAVVD